LPPGYDYAFRRDSLWRWVWKGNNPLIATSLLANLAMSFEANRGQFDSQVSFLSRGRGYALRLGPTDTSLVLRKPIPSAATKAKARRSRASRDTHSRGQAYSISNLRMSLV